MNALLLTLAVLSAAPAPTLPEQLLSAKLVVLVQVPPITCKPPMKCTPGLDWKARSIRRVLAPGGEEAPKDLVAPQLTLAASCKVTPPLAYVAAFTQDAKGAWKPVTLELQAKGRATSLDPSFDKLVDAIEETPRWHEERMRAVGADQLWQTERAALRAENPWLRAFSATFLKSHEAADAIDKAWGAPGSDERKAEELKSALPPPPCK